MIILKGAKMIFDKIQHQFVIKNVVDPVYRLGVSTTHALENWHINLSQPSTYLDSQLPVDP